MQRQLVVMKKNKKYILITFPTILLIALTINLYQYQSNQIENREIQKEIDTYQTKRKEFDSKKLALTDEINKLKEEKKDELWEYNRWIKWNQEIQEKIN